MIENSDYISLLNSFNPSESALLDWLVPHIDDSLLLEIAAADYGMEVEENFEALKSIRDRQDIPVPLPWIPREVLHLIRWSEPEDPEWKHPEWEPGITGTPGHLIRAFSCAVLLKAADAPEMRGYVNSENNTLIQLIASVLHLGSEVCVSALCFLCWRVLRRSFDDEDPPFFVLGLLLLRAALFEPGQDGASLSRLADWVVAEEAGARSDFARSEDWLLGLTFFEQQHEVWRKLAKEVLLDPTKAFPEPAATAMRNIVNRLAPEPG